MNLWKYIREVMLQHPFQTIGEGNASMSYEESVIFAESFSRRLDGEQCCAILCGSEMMAALGLLSCFAAGITAVPLSLRYGELHCNKLLDFISPTCVITDMDGELRVLHLKDFHYVPPSRHPALIMCTSGTTGAPKGVMLSEENILINVKDIAEYFQIGGEDTILIARPLYHCAVLTGEFLTALVKGSRICFFSEHFNPKSIWDVILQKKVTAFCGTPTLLDMMARFSRTTGTVPLQHIVVSGECMGTAVGKRLHKTFEKANIYHVYGLTEACPRVSYLAPTLFEEFPDYVGIPLSSVSVKILKRNNEPAKIDEEGILWVKGGNVMLGYYNNPERPGQILKNGWLCTGDIAEINEFGLLKIKGRSDDLIIRAGMNIYPQEVEASLKMDARVKEVFVYGTQTPKFGTQIGMKIAGDFAGVDEVKKLCAECLPAFQIPKYIELVEDIPKNGSGKIIRRK